MGMDMVGWAGLGWAYSVVIDDAASACWTEDSHCVREREDAKTLLWCFFFLFLLLEKKKALGVACLCSMVCTGRSEAMAPRQMRHAPLTL